MIKFISACVDAVVIGLLGLWLWGGVPWGDHRILTHGPDLRRAALAVFLLALWIFPSFRETSRVYAWVRSIWRTFSGASCCSHRARWTLLLVAAMIGSFVGVLRTYALGFQMYDVGIFHQIGCALAEGLGFHSTVSMAGNFLTDHFSPSLALLTPFFWISLWTSVSASWVLPILNPWIIFFGVGAWVYAAEQAPLGTSESRARAAASAAVFGSLFGSLWLNLRWGFHETTIAFAAFSWAMALVTTGRPSHFKWILILVWVAALSKETSLLTGAVFLMVWALKRPFKPLALLSAVVMIAGFILFERMPHPEGKNYFIRYYAHLGLNLSDFALTLIKQPWKIFEGAGGVGTFRFIAIVASPWVLIPFITSRWLGTSEVMGSPRFRWFLVALVPTFFAIVLSSNRPLRDPAFHYVLELWPVLGVLTAVHLVSAAHRFWAVAWVLAGFVSWSGDPVSEVRALWPEAIRLREVTERFESVPPGDSVIAHERSGPWLAARASVWRFSDVVDRALPICADHVFLPEGEWENISKINCARGPYVRVWEAQGWAEFRIP